MNTLVMVDGKILVVVGVFAGSQDHKIPNVLKVMDPTSGEHRWVVQDNKYMEFPDGEPQVEQFEDEEDEELRISSVEEFWGNVVEAATDLTWDVGCGDRDRWADGMLDRFSDLHENMDHLILIEECGQVVADHLFSRLDVRVVFN